MTVREMSGGTLNKYVKVYRDREIVPISAGKKQKQERNKKKLKLKSKSKLFEIRKYKYWKMLLMVTIISVDMCSIKKNKSK